MDEHRRRQVGCLLSVAKLDQANQRGATFSLPPLTSRSHCNGMWLMPCSRLAGWLASLPDSAPCAPGCLLACFALLRSALILPPPSSLCHLSAAGLQLALLARKLSARFPGFFGCLADLLTC